MKTKGKGNMSYTKADGSAQSRDEDSDFQLLTPKYWLLDTNSSLPFPKMKVHPAISMKTQSKDNMSCTKAGGSAQSRGEDSDFQLLTPESWLLAPNF
jgi:uncharacterized protein (DUF362 family)